MVFKKRARFVHLDHRHKLVKRVMCSIFGREHQSEIGLCRLVLRRRRLVLRLVDTWAFGHSRGKGWGTGAFGSSSGMKWSGHWYLFQPTNTIRFVLFPVFVPSFSTQSRFTCALSSDMTELLYRRTSSDP